MKSMIKCLASLVTVAIVALLIAGCTNPFVDSWSGETVDDALITFEDETYNLATLQKMKIPPGDYRVIVGSPNHHSVETIINLGSRDVPEIQLVPYSRIYSHSIIEAVLCPALDMRGQPVTPRWSYSSRDMQVIAWVMWNLPDDSYHYQTIRWYRPDGILYREEELPQFRAEPGSPVTTAPSLPLHQSPGWAVSPPIDVPGIWVAEIIIDGTLVIRMSFSI
jgi:hypothetical protein